MDSGGSRPIRAAVIALAVLAPAAIAPSAAVAGPARPNIVLIVTDDQTAASFNDRYMPRTRRQIAGHGVSFGNAVVSTPQCCPSRATMLTGQYAHNNGVVANNPGYGMLEEKRSVLPSWLRRAGYRTLHVGKFLNGYTQVQGLEPAPGWSRWLSVISSNYLHPGFSLDGEKQVFNRYLTRVIGGLSERLVDRYAPSRRPFYLQVDHFAPHVGGDFPGRCDNAAVPDPTDGDLFADEQAPRPPSFGEPDVSDKPAYIQALPSFGSERVDEIDRLYGCAVASLRAVDRSIGGLLKALRKSGELSSTMVIFTSDNGYSFGEHRLPNGKGLPYQEGLRVPLAVRPPRGLGSYSRSGATDPGVVANVDLAPTILELARARPCLRTGCRRLDGHSLVGLLRGRDPAWARNRAIRTGFEINATNYRLSCGWEGYWTPTENVARHTKLPVGRAGSCEPANVLESYDLVADPFELRSVTPEADQLARLARLRDCSGIRGRDKQLERRGFCE